jgi:hypothetical protein
MVTTLQVGFGRICSRKGWPAGFGRRLASSRLPTCLLLIPLLLACGSDATGPGDDIAGTYALQTVDGMSLPALVLQAGNESVEILNGEILLRANGTFRSSINRRDTVAGTSTTTEQVDEGEWGRTGSALTLFFPDGDRDAATVNGGTLTVNSAGFVFVFVRT